MEPVSAFARTSPPPRRAALSPWGSLPVALVPIALCISASMPRAVAVPSAVLDSAWRTCPVAAFEHAEAWDRCTSVVRTLEMCSHAKRTAPLRNAVSRVYLLQLQRNVRAELILGSEPVRQGMERSACRSVVDDPARRAAFEMLAQRDPRAVDIFRSGLPALSPRPIHDDVTWWLGYADALRMSGDAAGARQALDAVDPFIGGGWNAWTKARDAVESRADLSRE